jgi:hypothetical protein
MTAAFEVCIKQSGSSILILQSNLLPHSCTLMMEPESSFETPVHFYRVLILSDNHHLSLPCHYSLACVGSQQVDNTNMANELTASYKL